VIEIDCKASLQAKDSFRLISDPGCAIAYTMNFGVLSGPRLYSTVCQSVSRIINVTQKRGFINRFKTAQWPGQSQSSLFPANLTCLTPVYWLIA
jgi:hypothetical protein